MDAYYTLAKSLWLRGAVEAEFFAAWVGKGYLTQAQVDAIVALGRTG
jgi:hypothetical protein